MTFSTVGDVECFMMKKNLWFERRWRECSVLSLNPVIYILLDTAVIEA